MNNEQNTIYPVIIIADRYGGVYSGGKYTAWPCTPWDIPVEAAADDVTCAGFWAEHGTELVGLGNTPDEAMNDLINKVLKKASDYDG